MPRTHNEFRTNLRYFLHLRFVAPARHGMGYPNEMYAGVDGHAEGKVIVNVAVAFGEPLDQPLPSLDTLEQEQVVYFGNHLAQVEGSDTELAHFPVDDEGRRLLAFLKRNIGNQSADRGGAVVSFPNSLS